ncbi:MAG: 2-oxo acid dehydrogenase subunit E2 [Planctomycetaceae bacterium]|nr:2-oxo acid dehydrogenase subunit E2 [Planctomycetaceae bacterium]
MEQVSVKIPQLGEGLQEARLVEFLKQPGDVIRKDEPIYEIETDKAITEIESPYDGTLIAWVAEVDSVLPIGADIATMEVADGTPEMGDGHGSPAVASAPLESAREESAVAEAAAPPSAPAVVSTEPALAGGAPVAVAVPPRPAAAPLSIPFSPAHTAANGIPIPPRVRRLLREKGIAHLATEIPATGKRLSPEDVDAFLAKQQTPTSVILTESTNRNATHGATVAKEEYSERPLNSQERTLNFRMARGAQLVLPATLETDVDWTAIHEARQQTRESGGPTGFAMLSWCVARTLADFPQFRSSLTPDGNTLRTYKHVNLGIAVSLEDDLLNTAVIRHADTLNRAAFFDEMVDRISDARNGIDQIDATTTVSLSNIGRVGMRVGIPVVVTPAVATLAVGAVRDEPVPLDRGFEFRKMVSLTMSFDHRLVNGVGAAEFLNAIRKRAAEFRLTETV